MDINKLLEQAQNMQKQMAESQEQMASKEYSGKAGGGLVTVTLNGKYEMVQLAIDDSLMVSSEKTMLEDLMKAAFNDAKSQIEDDSQNSMSGMMSSMGLPPGFKPPSF